MTDVGERPHLLRELGFRVRRAGSGLVGRAVVTPFMHVPGGGCLRMSILATWADTVAGLLAAEAMRPRVPATLDLHLEVAGRPPAEGVVEARGTQVKQGRSVFVAEVVFSAGAGSLMARAVASFMASPNAAARLPANLSIDAEEPSPPLTVPFAERASCQRVAPGVAGLPRLDDGLNSANTINGGLIALAAEEALLSLQPGHDLGSLGLSYLAAARTGPLIATATSEAGLGRVELREGDGPDGRLCALATGRIRA